MSRKKSQYMRFLNFEAPPQQKQVLFMLMCRPIVKKEDIEKALWTEWNLPLTDCVPSIVSQLKVRLKPLGWTIRFVHQHLNSGWQLSHLHSYNNTPQ